MADWVAVRPRATRTTQNTVDSPTSLAASQWPGDRVWWLVCECQCVVPFLLFSGWHADVLVTPCGPWRSKMEPLSADNHVRPRGITTHCAI